MNLLVIIFSIQRYRLLLALAMRSGSGSIIHSRSNSPGAGFSISGPTRSSGSLYSCCLFSEWEQFCFFALYNVEEYENHLSLYRDLPLLMILFPLVFFLNLWVPIRLKYSVGNWFWISFLVYCTVTVILGLASPIDQEHMNEAWRRHNAPYDAIVHQELKRAHDNGIRITPDAAGTLKLKYRQSVHDLARSLKERFKSEKPVSADSVVMELILLKRGTIWRLIPSDWDDPEDLWPFVLPRDVYHQIQLSSDPVKTAYLRELLLEFKSIFRPEDPWEAPGEALEYNYHHRQFMQDLYPEIEAETKKYLHLLEEK